MKQTGQSKQFAELERRTKEVDKVLSLCRRYGIDPMEALKRACAEKKQKPSR